MRKTLFCSLAWLVSVSLEGHELLGTIVGENQGDQYGSAFCTVDFNNDGYQDLVVSASAADDAGLSSGKVYIYYGGPAADTVADLTIAGAASSFFGKALASAGDFNSDGAEDLLVGAPFYDVPASNAGAAYLFYGGTTPDTAVDHIFTGQVQSDYFGISVAGIGDFDNDGKDDIAIGAYKADWESLSNAGKVYVYYGGQSPDFQVDRILVGEADGERFGYSLAGGDFNGNGTPDIAVGAYSYDSSLSVNLGRIYLFNGGTTPDTLPDLIVTGDSAGYKFGWALSDGEVNSDAYLDLVMGTDGFPIDTFSAGRVYVFDGGPTMDGTPYDTYDLGRMKNDYLGFSVASGIDLDSDGNDEVVAGMPGNSDGGDSAGGAVLLSGGSTLALDTTIIGSGTGEQMGHAVFLWPDFGSGGSIAFGVGGIGYDSFRGRVMMFKTSDTSTVNQPPVLDSIGPKDVREGESLVFTVTASDPDGTFPSLSTSDLPPNASFVDHDTGSGTLTFNPDYDQADTYNVTFYASDGQATDSEQVQITVDNVNRPPILDSIGPKYISVGSNLSFTITAADPDGEAPTLTAESLPAAAEFTDQHDGTGDFSWTPTDADTGLHGVTFIASDGALADSEVVAITVRDSASCCVNLTGNVDGDEDEIIDIGDVTALIDYLYIRPGVEPPECMPEANVDGDPEGIVDIGDVTHLIKYLYLGGDPPAPCP